MSKQEVSMRATKMLGWKTADERYVPIDIFTNPADCLTVMKMLGDKGINVRPIFDSNNKLFGWSHYDVFNDLDAERTAKTLEESVAAAVMEVGDE